MNHRAIKSIHRRVVRECRFWLGLLFLGKISES